MNAKTLTETVVGLAVIIILMATLLMPVLNDATQTHETFDNTQYAYFQMKELEVGDSWTYSDSTWSYGDEALTPASTNAASIIATDNGVIRQSGIVRSETVSTNTANSAEVITVDSSEALLISNYYNLSYTAGYGAVPEGDYILKTFTDAAYVNGDTNLWVTGYTALATGSASQVIVHIEGTIDDGLTITVTNAKNSTVTDITVGEYTLDYEAVDGYEDLYTVTGVSFDVTGTYSDESVTTTFTYSTFVLPKEVTAELSQHLTDDENAIFNMIPIIVIASIVVAAVGMIATGRRD